jgi:hypothetical protein
MAQNVERFTSQLYKLLELSPADINQASLATLKGFLSNELFLWKMTADGKWISRPAPDNVRINKCKPADEIMTIGKCSQHVAENVSENDANTCWHKHRVVFDEIKQRMITIWYFWHRYFEISSEFDGYEIEFHPVYGPYFRVGVPDSKFKGLNKFCSNQNGRPAHYDHAPGCNKFNGSCCFMHILSWKAIEELADEGKRSYEIRNQENQEDNINEQVIEHLHNIVPENRWANVVVPENNNEEFPPIAEAPAPVVEAPAPVVEAPAPVVEAPAPVQKRQQADILREINTVACTLATLSGSFCNGVMPSDTIMDSFVRGQYDLEKLVDELRIHQ